MSDPSVLFEHLAIAIYLGKLHENVDISACDGDQVPGGFIHVVELDRTIFKSLACSFSRNCLVKTLIIKVPCKTKIFERKFLSAFQTCIIVA